MARLSPKALRFAKLAMQSLILLYPRGDDGSVWEKWGEQKSDFQNIDHLAKNDGFFDVPDDMASLFLKAIQITINKMEIYFDVNEEFEPDIGNDLEFLYSVEISLRRDLDYENRDLLHKIGM